MTGTKPWYLSRTILASLVTIATSAASLMGIGGGAIDSGALTDLLIQSISGVMGVIAVMGRITATKAIR
jgi:hypothetical protein